MISRFSLITAVLLFNLAMCIVAALRRRTGYLARYSTLALVLLALLGALRIILPLDFSFALVVNSFKILPAIGAVLEMDLWPGLTRVELQTVLLLIWGIGSSVIFLRTVYVLYKHRMRIRGFKVAESAPANIIVQRLRLKHVRVVVSPDIGVPYVTGLFRATIYLPEMTMPDDILEMIIEHEYQHFRSHDILIKAFYLLLSVVFWWNPIVHIFLRELDRLLEIRCDASITKRMSEEERLTYLHALLMVMKHIRPEDSAALANASALVQMGQDRFMEQRFHVILDSGKKRSAKLQIIPVFLVVLLFLASFMIIIQPAYHPPGGDTFTISRENTYILFTRDNTYKLYVDGQFTFEISEASTIMEQFANIPIITEED